MAYRGIWYPLISTGSTSVNGDYITRDEWYNRNNIVDEQISNNNNLAIAALKYVKAPDQETSVALDAAYYYIFSEVQNLELTFLINNDLKRLRNEYSFSFISGETPTVLTLPAAVKWANELTIEANKRYEVSIVDNVGLWCAVEVSE